MKTLTQIIVEMPTDEQRAVDVRTAEILADIDADIAAGRNVGGMPEDLVATLRQVAADVDVDLDDPIYPSWKEGQNDQNSNS